MARRKRLANPMTAVQRTAHAVNRTRKRPTPADAEAQRQRTYDAARTKYVTRQRRDMAAEQDRSVTERSRLAEQGATRRATLGQLGTLAAGAGPYAAAAGQQLARMLQGESGQASPRLRRQEATQRVLRASQGTQAAAELGLARMRRREVQTQLARGVQPTLPGMRVQATADTPMRTFQPGQGAYAGQVARADATGGPMPRVKGLDQLLAVRQQAQPAPQPDPAQAQRPPGLPGGADGIDQFVQQEMAMLQQMPPGSPAAKQTQSLIADAQKLQTAMRAGATPDEQGEPDARGPQGPAGPAGQPDPAQQYLADLDKDIEFFEQKMRASPAAAPATSPGDWQVDPNWQKQRDLDVDKSRAAIDAYRAKTTAAMGAESRAAEAAGYERTQRPTDEARAAAVHAQNLRAIDAKINDLKARTAETTARTGTAETPEQARDRRKQEQELGKLTLDKLRIEVEEAKMRGGLSNEDIARIGRTSGSIHITEPTWRGGETYPAWAGRLARQYQDIQQALYSVPKGAARRSVAAAIMENMAEWIEESSEAENRRYGVSTPRDRKAVLDAVRTMKATVMELRQFASGQLE